MSKKSTIFNGKKSDTFCKTKENCVEICRIGMTQYMQGDWRSCSAGVLLYFLSHVAAQFNSARPDTNCRSYSQTGSRRTRPPSKARARRAMRSRVRTLFWLLRSSALCGYHFCFSACRYRALCSSPTNEDLDYCHFVHCLDTVDESGDDGTVGRQFPYLSNLIPLYICIQIKNVIIKRR